MPGRPWGDILTSHHLSRQFSSVFSLHIMNESLGKPVLFTLIIVFHFFFGDPDSCRFDSVHHTEENLFIFLSLRYSFRLQTCYFLGFIQPVLDSALLIMLQLSEHPVCLHCLFMYPEWFCILFPASFLFQYEASFFQSVLFPEDNHCCCTNLLSNDVW